MEISERPQRRAHFPKSQLPNYPWGYPCWPQLGIYFWVFTRKLRWHLTTPHEFWTTLSVPEPLWSDRIVQKNKEYPAKAHLESSEPSKAVMKSRTVYNLFTWRVLKESFTLSRCPGQMRKSWMGWPTVAQYPGPLGRNKEEASYCVQTKLET